MTSVENESAEHFMNNDDSDINDEDNEVEIHYVENCWNQDEEIKTGYSYKGKKQNFLKAVENVKLLLKKGVQNKLHTLHLKFLIVERPNIQPSMILRLQKLLIEV